MFSGIFGLYLLEKSRKMSNILLSQNQIKTIPSHTSCCDISNGANGSKNRYCMEKLFNSEVFIKQSNASGTVPRGTSRGRHVDCMEMMWQMTMYEF